ncbi:MAG: glycosyltransferase family 39 protein [Bacteroidota bacterium]|nr:glycosyltransferase family 39 protein [Bacteroidota bacterium]
MTGEEQKSDYRFYTAALVLITICGGILRFHNLEGTSLFNDELSALSRLRFPNFRELITKGVAVDGHPAGVQAFLYYYTQVFGTSAIAIRLPFAIAGIFSIPVTYYWCRLWFGNATAIYVAAAVGFLELPLFYSQLARPYAIGFLVSQCLLLVWTKFTFEERGKIKYAVLFALLLVLSAYIHYLCLFFAACITLAGFSFIKKPDVRIYMLAIGAAIILFIPHIPLTVGHLQEGGLDWIGKPGIDFFYRYPFYLFQESFLLIIMALGLVIYSLSGKAKSESLKKFQLLTLFLFLVPLLTAWLKSYFGKPVLQYSLLIFEFPLFFGLIFSALKSDKITKALLPVWCAGILMILLYERDYFVKEHYGQFKPLADKYKEWRTMYTADSVLFIANFNNPYYINYYLENTDSIPFFSYRNDDLSKVDRIFKEIMATSKPYLAYGWSNIGNPRQLEDIINNRYRLIEDEKHFNSGIRLYKAKNKEQEIFLAKPLNDLNIGKDSVFLEIPYRPVLFDRLVRVVISGSDTLPQDVSLAVVLDEKGTVKHWSAANTNDIRDDMPRDQLHYFGKIPVKDTSNTVLRVFLWNPKQRKFSLDTVLIEIY